MAASHDALASPSPQSALKLRLVLLYCEDDDFYYSTFHSGSASRLGRGTTPLRRLPCRGRSLASTKRS